jgi:hypothetical protein
MTDYRSTSHIDEKSASQTLLSPISDASAYPETNLGRAPPSANQLSAVGSLTSPASDFPRPLPVAPSLASATQQQQRPVEEDIANVPGLVDTLNRLLQRLPVGGQQHDEPPPSYGI